MGQARAASLLLAVFVTACTSAEPRVDRVARAELPIKDGYDDADDTAVVALSSPSLGSLCSGSLIAPNVVLTARHCVSSTDGGGTVSCATTGFGPVRDGQGFLMTTAAEVTPGNSGEFFGELAVGLAGIPGIPGSVEDDELLCGQDVAILILAENVPDSVAVPYEPLLEELPAGTMYYAVGYGAVDGDGNEAGKRRRRDDLAVLCSGNAECVAAEVPEVLDGEWVGGGGVCQGDSGGPALDLENRVVGITSRGDNPCEISIYAYPAAHAQWIKNTVVYASGMGLYEPPAWTEGATVDPSHSLPVGDACQSGSDCPSGVCIIENDLQYCSRPCTEDGPCPDEYVCEDRNGEAVCVQPPPVEPRPFARAPRDDCSMSNGQPDGWWPVLLALMASRSRRARQGDRTRTRRPPDR